ncbi:hypothetical protein RDI58_022176 [Solanum bulbocastanum]|uniref:Uncharacterized protein n=1 Tax=Solanum bulbocastanum TaxID=147425 RepID=A0AAN8T701_SOLBU
MAFTLIFERESLTHVISIHFENEEENKVLYDELELAQGKTNVVVQGIWLRWLTNIQREKDRFHHQQSLCLCKVARILAIGEHSGEFCHIFHPASIQISHKNNIT